MQEYEHKPKELNEVSKEELIKFKIYLKELKKQYFAYKELFWFNAGCNLNLKIEKIDSELSRRAML